MTASRPSGKTSRNRGTDRDVVENGGKVHIEYTDCQGFLVSYQHADIRHRPIESDEPKQALSQPGRLTARHAEEHFHRQARLDCGIALLRLPASLARRRRRPSHVRIESDRQGAALLQRFVVGRPVLRLVAQRDERADAGQPPRWLHKMNSALDVRATMPERAEPGGKASQSDRFLPNCLEFVTYPS